MQDSEKPKDETPIVAVEFTSAALALLVSVLNDAGPEDGSKVETQDLSRGLVRVVVTPAPEPVAEPAPAEPSEDPTAGTVAEVTETVSKAKQLDQLDTLEKAEKEGKARKGVLEAIEKRRAELKG